MLGATPDGGRSAVEVHAGDEPALPRCLDGSRSVVSSRPSDRFGRRYTSKSSKKRDRSSSTTDPTAARNLHPSIRGLAVGIAERRNCLRDPKRQQKVRPTDPYRFPRLRRRRSGTQVDPELWPGVHAETSVTKSPTTDPATVGQDHETVGVFTPRGHGSTLDRDSWLAKLCPQPTVGLWRWLAGVPDPRTYHAGMSGCWQRDVDCREVDPPGGIGFAGTQLSTDYDGRVLQDERWNGPRMHRLLKHEGSVGVSGTVENQVKFHGHFGRAAACDVPRLSNWTRSRCSRHSCRSSLIMFECSR